MGTLDSTHSVGGVRGAADIGARNNGAVARRTLTTESESSDFPSPESGLLPRSRSCAEALEQAAEPGHYSTADGEPTEPIDIPDTRPRPDGRWGASRELLRWTAGHEPV
eukprot:COSAG06_NODE_123_length_23014_cov_10.698058_3_plen_109_part_00